MRPPRRWQRAKRELVQLGPEPDWHAEREVCGKLAVEHRRHDSREADFYRAQDAELDANCVVTTVQAAALQAAHALDAARAYLFATERDEWRSLYEQSELQQQEIEARLREQLEDAHQKTLRAWEAFNYVAGGPDVGRGHYHPAFRRRTRRAVGSAGLVML